MLPAPCRLTLCQTGRTKALFSDNSLLLLNAAGSGFLYIGPDEARVAQVSEYAVSKLRPLLRVALEFRNLHSDVPFYCKALTQTATFQLGYRIRTVRWPISLELAMGKQLLEQLGPKNWALKTEDSCVRAVVQLHIQRVAFSYPLLVCEVADQSSYTYTWQTSVFSLYEYPPRWEPAVALLLLAIEQEAAEQSLVSDSQAAWKPPKPPASSARDTQLPSSKTRFQEVGVTELMDDPWWAEPTTTLMPATIEISLDWKPEATYQYVKVVQEVQAWSHSEHSQVKTIQGGNYFVYSSEDNPSERFFSSEAIPEYLWTSEGKTGISLKAVVLHAIKLRQGMARVLLSTPPHTTSQVPTTRRPCNHSNPTPSPAGDVSADIVEEQHLPGVGHFTAFADGRVKASFEDRMLLRLDCSHRFASCILPDGTRAEVSVLRPGELQQYVAAALEFAGWAFRSPEGRTHVVDCQAVIEAQLQKSRRLAAICQLASSGTMHLNT